MVRRCITKDPEEQQGATQPRQEQRLSVRYWGWNVARALTRKGAIKKLDDLCRDIIWHRDKSTCRKCKRLMTRADREGNVHHCVPKKRGYHVRWETDNLILFCARCHFWWHEDPEAIIWLMDDDPEVIDSISELNQEQTKSYKQQDLLDLIDTLTNYKEKMGIRRRQ